MAVILECQDLRFTYRQVPVLDHISFKVQSGRFCAILGRNGSGKTTLLHCLNNILTPDSGKVLVHGQDIADMGQNQIAQQISLVPQEHLDIFPYRVIDVVVMGRAPFLRLSQRPGPSDFKMAHEALDFLNAGSLAVKNFNQISGGERQICLLARAITQTKHLMLLDEPTNHLDFNNQYHLLSAIKSLCRSKGISIVATLHDPNMAAMFADDLIMVKNNTIMEQGTAGETMTKKNISALYDIPLGIVKINEQKKLFFPENILSEPMNPKKTNDEEDNGDH
jgi:iron complex transport system ATP-binding protein